MKNLSAKTGMRIGSTVGGMVFAIFGIMPGFYLGSYGALSLLQKLVGAVEPTLFVRVAVAIGIMVGITAAAAASLVVGGLIGSALGYVVSAPAAMRQASGKA